MNRISKKLFVASLLLCGVTSTGSAWAEPAGDKLHSASRIAATDAQREAISSAAFRVLRYITQARNAIHDNKLDVARQQVLQAQELLSLIEGARPVARLKEHIWVIEQHMGYDTSQDIISDLMLIDAELLVLSSTMSTEKAEQHLQAARELLSNNETQAALMELKQMESSLVFTEFDLPLASCEQQILAAQESLASNDSVGADKHLVAAEESIQFVTLGGSAPLVSARITLKQAARNYSNEYYSAAQADLAQASEWLQRAGASGNKKASEEAIKLAEEINAMKEQLSDKDDDHTDTISGFLHHSIVLIEREAEDLWLKYKQEQNSNHTLKKLLDAKTHLYYAEFDLKNNRDAVKIRKQLESTDQYLVEALSVAEPAMREKINGLRNDVHKLEEGLSSGREQSLANYEEAMARFRHLIYIYENE